MTADSVAALTPQVLDIETPFGVARAHVHGADGARSALVLGHGAGGGVGARDLVAVRDVALSEAVSVALVEQPYRVAGRRSPAPARQLDGAWCAVAERLRMESFPRSAAGVRGTLLRGARRLSDGRRDERGRRPLSRVPAPAARAHRVR